MTCTHFRTVVDAYVDGELAEDARAAADAHRRGCPACDDVVRQLFAIKRALRTGTAAIAPPRDLEGRVSQALRTADSHRWRARWSGWRGALAAAAALLLIALALTDRGIRAGTADVVDRLAVRLDDNREIVLQGTVLCRDCELEQRYGIKASCPTIGHHGALETSDGHIWNLVEQPVSDRLIHDKALLGRRVVVRGRIFRGARTLVVDSYELKG